VIKKLRFRSGGVHDANPAALKHDRLHGHRTRRIRPSENAKEKEDTMRVFVVGASGAIGTRLVPQLIQRGHEVIGTSTSPDRSERLRALGAEPVVLDLLDARAVREAVAAAEPDAIVNQATALANATFSKELDRELAQTNRLRTEGTDALLAGAREAGVARLVAQSFASMRYARVGGPVKSEGDPLDATPVAGMEETAAAMNYLDETVVAAGGIALRYGLFYGAANDGLIEPVRKRRFPIVGDGDGVATFIHLEDAAAATVLALELTPERWRPAIYHVADDEPAPVREWLPVLAEALGAKPPRRVPVWLARLIAGDAAVMLGTEARGASNAKAKRELGWTLRYPSWRQGFAEVYAKSIASTATQIPTPARSYPARTR
jgi:nucleoside-diphosphate-sugar epimerase